MSNFEYDIGFIGAGNMGFALAEGFVQNASTSPKILAADPWRLAEKQKKWESLGIVRTKENSEVLEKCRLVILSIKPQLFKAVSEKITNKEKTQGQILVSVVAGLSLETMKKTFPQVQNQIRIMTNTACLIKAGVIAITPADDVPATLVTEVKELLDSCGVTEIVPERCMDAVTGMSGSGIAFVYQFIEALADGGVNAGLPRNVAAKFAAQTVMAGAQMVIETGRHPGSLKDDVTSPAGTTIAGIRAAERGGLRSAVIEAVTAAAVRSEELSKLSK